jgi:hypothetical protein
MWYSPSSPAGGVFCRLVLGAGSIALKDFGECEIESFGTSCGTGWIEMEFIMATVLMHADHHPRKPRNLEA